MTEQNPKLPVLRQKAMALPLRPGVYLMKDRTGKVIYVGKAKQLKSRVSQYFGTDRTHTEKVRQMVCRVDDFDYILADSEFEALVLECSLIKQYNPKYNILLKDDKGYHYIKVSPPPFSRITASKQKFDDGARYIGPYMSSYAVKQAVDEACKICGLSTCARKLQYGVSAGRPCLNHAIGQCSAPCTGRIKPDEYAKQVEMALEYLTQGGDRLVESLTERMEKAAEELDFEKAATLRDRIAAIRRLQGRQKVVETRVADQDVFAIAVGNGHACAEVFRFEHGRMTDREEFLFEPDGTVEEMRGELLRRYYSLRDRVPPQITLDGETEDAELLEQWLSDKAGRRVKVHVPVRGEQADLTRMCRDNAAEAIARAVGAKGQDVAALDELARLLGLDKPPVRIESYDISHTAGNEPVAGMVVFRNGKPHKADYRRFMIKQAAGGDDPAAMWEVLSRRMAEYEQRRANGETEGFAALPDLVLMDGGDAQVAAVKPLLDRYGVPVFGLVKDSHHRTRAIAAGGGELAIHAKRAAFTLVSSIQEEVHRYAIAYHRQKRKQAGIGTALREIDGVGEARAKALLKTFGSVAAIRRANVEAVAAVKGISPALAERIVNELNREA